MPPDLAEHLRSLVRDIPDFPQPGIVFKDITPLLLDPSGLDAAVSGLAAEVGEREVDYVVAPEARGFILGGALARALGSGFVPARRPGKLPHETVSAQYALEYGINALEMHADALSGGARVLVHDDLLATGGTALALCELAEARGAEVVGAAFLIELSFLSGRDRLAPRHVSALIDYPGLMPTTRRSRTIAARPELVWELIADPHHMPRWWPGVKRMEDVQVDRWTQVFTTKKGRAVRLDYRLLDSEAPGPDGDPPGQRRWEQEIDGTPFERVLSEAITEMTVEGAAEGTKVTIAQIQRLRGYSRTGGFLLRRATRSRLDEALDGLQDACQ